jgi:WD40 repeat protein
VFASVALSADGRLGAAGNCGWLNESWNLRPAIRVWDTEFASQRAILLGHTDWVLDVAFNNDGNGLVSAGKDGTVRYWKLP